MEYGICLRSVIPVRGEPSHRAEMVTEVLFGELFCITERLQSWCRVRLDFDRYEGWIDSLQADEIDESEYLRLANSETYVTTDLVQLLSHETQRSMIPVLVGSSLPAAEDSRFRIGQSVFFYDGDVSGHAFNQANPSPLLSGTTRQQLLEDAMLYLNAPYLWGGRTPFGIDCSGFVQMVYKLQGLKLLRDASQQAGQGETISLLNEARPGDLAFFDDPEGNITHVGILMEDNMIIHCSGAVSIDHIDHEGIYSARMQRYTHKLRVIKRII
jgi:hypothetical protein